MKDLYYYKGNYDEYEKYRLLVNEENQRDLKSIKIIGLKHKLVASEMGMFAMQKIEMMADYERYEEAMQLYNENKLYLERASKFGFHKEYWLRCFELMSNENYEEALKVLNSHFDDNYIVKDELTRYDLERYKIYKVKLLRLLDRNEEADIILEELNNIQDLLPCERKLVEQLMCVNSSGGLS